jgi:hypothetical protein
MFRLPSRRWIVTPLPSQKRLASVILECLGIPHVAGENIQRLVTAHGLHLPDRGAGRRGTGDEACAQAMPAELLGLQTRQRCVLLHKVGDGTA